MPMMDPCSSCGRNDAVFWAKVISTKNKRKGWRWTCTGCGAGRVILSTEVPAEELEPA